ncbi:TIC 40, chloroplastic [Olea europaea subsp. europaea]|uniref:TIC 40, chloroplastic n=1 Tax=Olea europaea subsp. europaea TaxID=158383 RepID=A0A8S0U4W7_OLEEU|nr:TIC 40, chloroplastic [Olea europaea subsp. europaea]
MTIGYSPEWDNRLMDSSKNFDLSSPEIKQQFGEFYTLVIILLHMPVDQIGLTPEEVISKIMPNPDVAINAMAFQNPRVQAAIKDVLNATGPTMESS